MSTDTSSLKIGENTASESRKDPTSFLPDEPMTYELKVKKKKKKKKKDLEDPFKDIEEKQIPVVTVVKEIESEHETTFEPEVTIKVENIEVELDFNDFDGELSSLFQNQDSQEKAVRIEHQNHEATILTFENIIKERTIGELVLDEDNQEVLQPPSSEHTCKVCHLIFKNARTLWMHQKRKHKKFRRSFKHICDYCGMSYEQKNSLVAHIKRKHDPATALDEEERPCDICSLVFKGRGRLRMHMKRKHNVHEESFSHACDECGLTYDKYRSLIVHIQRKHSNMKKPAITRWYNCPMCPKIFGKRETYARHMQRKHIRREEDEEKDNKKDLETLKLEITGMKNEYTGELTCRECSLVFSSVNYLKLHLRRKHNALKEEFRMKCRICNLTYDKVESLKRHIWRKHSGKERHIKKDNSKGVYECTLCRSIFASQGGLAKHLRCTHKLEGPKVVFCHICSEGFHDKRLLRPHIMKEHLKVSYTCKVCKKVFKCRESYKKHVIFRHPITPDTKLEMHQCDQCTETFTDEFELCKHINVAHSASVKVEKVETDPYQCNKCPERFENWENLKLHYEQNHYLCNKVQCQSCGEFVPEINMKKHMKMHEVTNFECKYCDFKTTIKASMTQHTLRHKNATTIHCDHFGCRYKTFYEEAMRKHKLKHEETTKLQCAHCPFQTMNKYIMRYHEEAHTTGKKKYQCDQCDYATILPANLVQHKYKHATEKRFKCDMCPFATKYNTSLRFHVRKKHCDLPN